MPSAELTHGLAAALGALQGVAEFLPISSSGHLSLAEAWLGVDPAAVGHRFNVVVHAGTLLAVLWVYRGDLYDLLRGLLRRETPARRLALALVLATLPLALALAPPLERALLQVEGSPRLIGVALLITAALLAFTHHRSRPGDDPHAIPTARQAVVIGLFQLLAITPGISRSGATIAAGLGLGLGRLPAARFSFLLSIPAILGASAKELLDLRGAAPLTAEHSEALLIGLLAALLVGLLSLRLLLGLLVRVGLLPFVPYLLALALAAFVLG
ncbi:MAG: undecaprenyl-diphosphate phosphatase [Nannocystis sp.]|nr:undecaprenyl-diphosphate phosphatase [Nannocystis sp.]